MYDLVIRNGKIIDGTGSPAYFADIAVRNGKIVRIGKGITGGGEIIDAAGLCVTPGFIDSHSHSDRNLLNHPEHREKVEQGITSCIAGQCGGSIAPLSKEAKHADFRQYPEPVGDEYQLRQTYHGFLDTAKHLPQGCNTAVLLGHGSLRGAVMGMARRAPSPDEMEEMKRLVRAAMEHGAPGMSFGLYYAPGCYADTAEAVELARVVGEYHGIIAAHIRDEAEYLVRSVREFLSIAKAAGTRAVISHHKSHHSPENWGKVTHTLRMIDQANEEGQEIYCDVYPYIASNTTLSATFLPKEEHARPDSQVIADLKTPAYRSTLREYITDLYGADLSWVQTTSGNPYPECAGMTVPEIAAAKGTEPFDALFDLLIDSGLGASAAFFSMCEEDVETVMAHPRAMICTDSGNAGKATYYHPRLRASFPRAIGEYAIRRGVVPLPEMIRKITSMPARVYNLPSKGLIWENMDADICVFDEKTFRDKATYRDITARAEGLKYVLVSGKIVVRDAVSNGEKYGKVLTF